MNVNDGTEPCPHCGSGMYASAIKEAHRANKAEARVAELEAGLTRLSNAAYLAHGAVEWICPEDGDVLLRHVARARAILAAKPMPPSERPPPSVSPLQENKMSDHDFKFMSSHGQDAPGLSLDTYEQCTTCGLVRHDYRHGGGQRSPNYPIYLVRGVHHATPPACIGIVSETKGKEPTSPLGEDDCG